MTLVTCDKKEAASIIHTCMDDIKVYTDSSGFKDDIGVAALATHQDSSVVCQLQHQFGKISHHTVFKANLIGVLLAVHIIHSKVQCSSKCSKCTLIALDN